MISNQLMNASPRSPSNRGNADSCPGTTPAAGASVGAGFAMSGSSGIFSGSSGSSSDGVSSGKPSSSLVSDAS